MGMAPSSPEVFYAATAQKQRDGGFFEPPSLREFQSESGHWGTLYTIGSIMARLDEKTPQNRTMEDLADCGRYAAARPGVTFGNLDTASQNRLLRVVRLSGNLQSYAAWISSSAFGRSIMRPSSLTSSNRTDTCFVMPDSCIVTP